MKALVFLFLGMFLFLASHAQKLVSYQLHVTDTVVNYNGKNKTAIAVNGSIPMPTLFFTEGDTALITVHNHLHHETSIHWHGLLLPNEQDGVSYLTTQPILSHASHTFKFVLRQHGTYWYHSHTMLQEQVGMYGAIVIYPKNNHIKNDQVLLLSDWSNENPHQIERSLHYATDWYMIKKNAVQSYAEAIRDGYLSTKLGNEMKRMHAMDVSDVYYENFLVNGKVEERFSNYFPGDTIRLRIINGSSSTYFWISSSTNNLRVIASDGVDVQPVNVNRFIVAVSEIYDVEIIVPDSNGIQIMATSEDRMGNVIASFGAVKSKMPPLGRLNYFEGMQMMNDMMLLNGNIAMGQMNMGLQKLDMNSVMYPELSASSSPVTLNYTMLKAVEPTTLPKAEYTTYNFELTGNMNRYVWTLNRKTISESDKILIQPGQNIRIIISNNSMMRHPMHLHGHFFRVLNGQGEFAPLKNVLDIMPMEVDTIEFNASEQYGSWYFHCHILYHMMAGMGRIFEYENSPVNPQLPDAKKALRKVYHDDRRFYLGAEVGFESNGSDGELSLMNTRWRFETEWRLGVNRSKGYEKETHIARYLDRNQFLQAYIGWDWRYRSAKHADISWFNQYNTKDQRNVACIGVNYVMPFFFRVDLRIDHNGYVRVQILRDDIALTKRLRGWAMINSDNEFGYGLRYQLSKYFALSSHYDSDMGYGAGLTITY